MTIYEINKEIEALITDDGEVNDIDALEMLGLARDEKIENTALYIKNLRAEAKALKEEIDALQKRKKSCENNEERLVKLLVYSLNGEPFKTSRCDVRWRRSVRTVIKDEEQFKASYPQFVRVKSEISLADVSNELKVRTLVGAELEERNNVIVK